MGAYRPIKRSPFSRANHRRAPAPSRRKMGCGPSTEKSDEKSVELPNPAPQLPNCISVHARITDPDGMGEENRDLSLYQEHAIGMTTAHALGVQESSVLLVSMGGFELDLKGSWLTEEVEMDAVVSIRVKGWGEVKGTWTEHKNIDMCNQGDVQIIHDWKKSHTLDQLKAIVEENGYSAVTVAGKNEFGHAAIKSFDYQLTAERCKPSSGYTCTIWIYQRPKGVNPKPQWWRSKVDRRPFSAWNLTLGTPSAKCTPKRDVTKHGAISNRRQFPRMKALLCASRTELSSP